MNTPTTPSVTLEALFAHPTLSELGADTLATLLATATDVYGTEADPIKAIATTAAKALGRALGTSTINASAIQNAAQALCPPDEPNGDIQIEMTGQASADASASAVAGAASSPFGPYAQLMVAGPSSALGGLGVVNPRIKKAFVMAGGRVVATFITLATGADTVLFNDAFWRSARLEDMDIRQQIFELTEKVARGEFVTQTSLKAMFNGVDTLLDGKFIELIDTCAEFAGAQELLSMSHAGGNIDLGRYAGPMSRMGILIPANGEKITNQMRDSALPEQSGGASKMIGAMMDIMRSPNFGVAVRAPAGLTPDETAVWFMQDRLGTGFSNRISLAQSYERLFNLFAVCPPVLQGVDKQQYLLAVGTTTNAVSAYHSLVDPELRKEVQAGSQASGFLAPVAGVPAQAESKAVARAFFSLNLKVSWGRK